MNPDSTITATIRHILTMLGGFLVNRGFLTGADLEWIIGGLLALGGLAWSYYNKHRTKQAIDTALDLEAGATRETLARVVETKPLR